MFYSQAGQDEWVADVFGYKRGGYYLDVGAYDGVDISNTLFFERHLGWSGMCIEALPRAYDQLCANRNSTNLNIAITDYNGKCFINDNSSMSQVSKDYTGIEVECRTLESVLLEYQAPLYIDYLSIDIEGNEYMALKNFNFDKWKIGVITAEHNLYLNGPDLKNDLYGLLSDNKFIRVVENVTSLNGTEPFEDWYINKEIIKEVNF